MMLSLLQILDSLGWDSHKYPKAFNDCFKIPKGSNFSSSALSTLLKLALPPSIDRKYDNGEVFLKEFMVQISEKLSTFKIFKEFQEIILDGLPLATAFQIVRYHEECKVFPEIMLQRETIQGLNITLVHAIKGAKAANNPEGERKLIGHVENIIKSIEYDFIGHRVMSQIKTVLMRYVLTGDPDCIELAKYLSDRERHVQAIKDSEIKYLNPGEL